MTVERSSSESLTSGAPLFIYSPDTPEKFKKGSSVFPNPGDRLENQAGFVGEPPGNFKIGGR
jgi:hypothetical protein